MRSYKFKTKLASLLPILSNNNHHAAFFHHMVQNELYLLMEQDKSHQKSINFALHPIPLQDNRIRFLPMFTQINSSVYKTEQEDYHSWVAGGENYIEYIETKKAYYSKKESWIVKTILNLSEGFGNELMKISAEKGIPVRYLFDIYSLIIATNDPLEFGEQPDKYQFNHLSHFPISASGHRSNRINTNLIPNRN